MAQKERLSRIRKTIKEEKKVVVSELSKEYGVTEETIRRDLEKLENEGLVTRTYGGAVLNMEQITENIAYLRRELHNHEEKMIIGELAASVIPTKATIGADASSTVMAALKCLRNCPQVTVLTNSIPAILEFDQSELNIISTGGVVNKNTYSMQGNVARRNLADYYVDIILTSCKALDLECGIFDSNEEEAELKKILVERGQKIYLLADHTKFNKVAFVKVLGFDNLDLVITDKEPSKEWKTLFKQKGIGLLYPGSK